jgi:hypothetical protein
MGTLRVFDQAPPPALYVSAPLATTTKSTSPSTSCGSDLAEEPSHRRWSHSDAPHFILYGEFGESRME